MQRKTFHRISSQTELSKKEVLSIIATLLAAALLTAMDLYEDRLEGVSWTHLLIEGTILVSTAAVIIYLWIRLSRQVQIGTSKLTADLNSALQKASRW